MLSSVRLHLGCAKQIAWSLNHLAKKNLFLFNVSACLPVCVGIYVPQSAYVLFCHFVGLEDQTQIVRPWTKVPSSCAISQALEDFFLIQITLYYFKSYG